MERATIAREQGASENQKFDGKLTQPDHDNLNLNDYMIYRDLTESEQKKDSFFWEVKNLPPFTELILSWNGFRPKKGKWHFAISLFEEEWHPYAEWGFEGQRTFASTGIFSKTHQDIISTIKDPATQFRIQVTGELSTLHSLYVYRNNLTNRDFGEGPTPDLCQLESVLLPNVPRASQMLLPHPRNRDLCSPTSTVTAINFLLGKKALDPVYFASQIRDLEFDIYGNWVLNTAESYEQLQGKFRTFVHRLPSFKELHAELAASRPVVVSIKGPLPGAPLPYSSGHLICVIGYLENQVICIDPAFPTDEKTFASYNLADFLVAWGRRKNLSYLFTHR